MLDRTAEFSSLYQSIRSSSPSVATRTAPKKDTHLLTTLVTLTYEVRSTCKSVREYWLQERPTGRLSAEDDVTVRALDRALASLPRGDAATHFGIAFGTLREEVEGLLHWVKGVAMREVRQWEAAESAHVTCGLPPCYEGEDGDEAENVEGTALPEEGLARGLTRPRADAKTAASSNHLPAQDGSPDEGDHSYLQTFIAADKARVDLERVALERSVLEVAELNRMLERYILEQDRHIESLSEEAHQHKENLTTALSNLQVTKNRRRQWLTPKRILALMFFAGALFILCAHSLIR